MKLKTFNKEKPQKNKYQNGSCNLHHHEQDSLIIKFVKFFTIIEYCIEIHKINYSKFELTFLLFYKNNWDKKKYNYPISFPSLDECSLLLGFLFRMTTITTTTIIAITTTTPTTIPTIIPIFDLFLLPGSFGPPFLYS